MNERMFRRAAETNTRAACAPQTGQNDLFSGRRTRLRKATVRQAICWRLWLRQRSCRSAGHRANHPSTVELRSPYDGPAGIVATISSCRALGRAHPSTRKPTPGWRRPGPQYDSLAIGTRSTARRASRIASSFRPRPASRHAASAKYSSCLSHAASSHFRAAANTDCAFCLSPRARATCPSAQLSGGCPTYTAANFAGVAAITRFAAS